MTTDEPDGWRYFETEEQMNDSGWESERDANDRLYTGIYRFRRVRHGGWEIMAPALRGRI